MHFYPESAGRRLDEARQGSKWLSDADPTLLTPMCSVGMTDFFVFEPTLLKNNILCMPHRFFTKDSAMWFRAWPITCDVDGWVIEGSDEYILPADDLGVSFPELKSYRNFPRQGCPPLTQIKGEYIL